MGSSVLERKAYQIESLPITDRVAFQRSDFVCIARSEKWQQAPDLRGQDSKFIDIVTNAGKNQH